uniref:topoisomerase DNA-binding C4 zinc finger domain-containing protein n=1 Tax=Gemmiger formicilis TaxID=745368 RepID=UPI003FEF64F7
MKKLKVWRFAGWAKITAVSKCPDCGYPLHRVEGKHGSLIGCSNYPWCNFTMPDNS